MPVVAALDLGSNTVKMTVAELAKGAPLRVLYERAEVTRIGEGLDKNGYLLEAAQARTLAELMRMSEAARAHGATRVAAVGTAGLRGASNAGAFLARVEAEAGIRVEVIDGMREADLAFRAPAGAFGPGPVTVVDLGGRSTEIIAGAGGHIAEKISLEVGSVRLTERCLPSDPPTDDELAAARAYFRGLLAGAPRWIDGGTLVGVSGTILALLGLELGVTDASVLARDHDGQTLHRAVVDTVYERFRHLKAAERVVGSIIPSGRADVIVAGMLIVGEIMDHYGQREMRVTGRGVRYGLLYELAAELERS